MDHEIVRVVDDVEYVARSLARAERPDSENVYNVTARRIDSHVGYGSIRVKTPGSAVALDVAVSHPWARRGVSGARSRP
jgi:hypothetical protein